MPEESAGCGIMSMPDKKSKKKIEVVFNTANGFGIGIYWFKGFIASDVDSMISINILFWTILFLTIPAEAD